MKQKSRVTAIILSIMMLFAMAPLTASALINGYQFELEVNATGDDNNVSVTEGDILTDGCGVGVISSDGHTAEARVGDVRASTVGIAAWSEGGSINNVIAGNITGDRYTEYALGATAANNHSTNNWRCIPRNDLFVFLQNLRRYAQFIFTINKTIPDWIIATSFRNRLEKTIGVKDNATIHGRDTSYGVRK